MQNIFSHRTLQSLYESARKLLDEGGSPELLREAVEDLEDMAQFRDSPTGQDVLDQAQKKYVITSDDYEVAVDDGTIIDHNEDNGYWVMAWCFVEQEELDGETEHDSTMQSSSVPDQERP